MGDGLQLTLRLAEVDAHERVNDTYEQYSDETYPGLPPSASVNCSAAPRSPRMPSSPSSRAEYAPDGPGAGRWISYSGIQYTS